MKTNLGDGNKIARYHMPSQYQMCYVRYACQNCDEVTPRTFLNRPRRTLGTTTCSSPENTSARGRDLRVGVAFTHRKNATLLRGRRHRN